MQLYKSIERKKQMLENAISKGKLSQANRINNEMSINEIQN